MAEYTVCFGRTVGMDKNMLLDEQKENVAAGTDGQSFARLAEDFARVNRCADCPHKMIYRQHEMCMEVYSELLQSYTSGKPVGMRCVCRG